MKGKQKMFKAEVRTQQFTAIKFIYIEMNVKGAKQCVCNETDNEAHNRWGN
jgi:hypothetical protein